MDSAPLGGTDLDPEASLWSLVVIMFVFQSRVRIMTRGSARKSTAGVCMRGFRPIPVVSEVWQQGESISGLDLPQFQGFKDFSWVNPQ